ncbi:MAG: hypothetical protein IJ760_00890 [Bacteroidales bacterium]|nr:hypothetical protein [Bacteroidales bacterium]
MDFTLERYRQLLRALKGHGNHAIRHDVDVSPRQALRLARLEAEEGARSVYYFRAKHLALPDQRHHIEAVAALGHSIGYHYENMATCHGDEEAAYADFVEVLRQARQWFVVEYASAHGSPLSPYDNMDLWKKRDIHALGIVHESMLDTDFANTLYLTDVGRMWDGYRVSVRDKVSAVQRAQADGGMSFHSTADIIRALSTPGHAIHGRPLLVNAHPERWNPLGPSWLWNVVMQTAKNSVKRVVVAVREAKR